MRNANCGYINSRMIGKRRDQEIRIVSGWVKPVYKSSSNIKERTTLSYDSLALKYEANMRMTTEVEERLEGKQCRSGNEF